MPARIMHIQMVVGTVGHQVWVQNKQKRTITYVR